jgi:hypothetical protein
VCLSSSNRTYDQYDIDGGGWSAAVCSSRCLKHEGFVGFYIQSLRWCMCYYEDGFFPKPCQSNYGNCQSQYDGIGEITYSKGGSFGECYKYQGGLMGMPSARPSVSSQPSYHPSVSVQPSISSQPSAQPSFSLSSNPSMSSAPTGVSHQLIFDLFVRASLIHIFSLIFFTDS